MKNLEFPAGEIRKTKKVLLSALLAVLVAANSFAGEMRDSIQSDKTSPPASPAASPTTLIVQSNVDSTRVYLDADSVGLTPLTISPVPPGKHRLRLVPPDVENWLSEPLVDSIFVKAGETQTVSYSMHRPLLIITSPSGASVFHKDSLLGTTPLVLKSEFSTLTLRKEGYQETSVNPAEAKSNILSSRLTKVWKSTPEDSVFIDSEEHGSPLRLYITGVGAIVAGAASAYFKVKADNSYSDYLVTGDPGTLTRVNNLDTAAGITLAATEISLGLFTYFMLSE